MSDPRQFNRSGHDRNNRDLLSWIPIVIFLFCFPPLGLFLLILRLVGVTGRRRGQVGRHPYDLQREAAAQDGTAQAEAAAASTQAGAARRRKASARSKAGKKLEEQGNGRLLTIAGAIVAAVFGLGAFSAFLDALSWGGLLYSLEDIFVPLAFCGGGLCMLWYGLRRGRRLKRYRQYLSLIGRRKSISVTTLAEATGFAPRKIREDLQDMLDDGIFPMGYLDLGSDQLFLTDDGIQDRPKEEPEKAPEPPKEVEGAEAVLTEIRALNDAIEDPEMSRKIDRIGEITGNIFAYLREKPDKEGKLRSFLSYYLPTTLKILGSYAQLEAQGVEGENISAAKERIEGMMDKVVEGFEQQLDRLFQDDAMDITSDVAVLERMLEKDGLGNSGMTLGS
ncbi:5-bromo-4-chloroindolyl phosphate hydrolysis family protein [Intestinimonas timonensis]|uniref:5-bromo-4-chloroindolyl phosphate hydrolysis family protein n=1 Tax=Intestinimonas timonensis TaxID=1689270 RepID=UPI0023F3C552|nr:5-bromo-4-chloroindolyl phosphate hydrolysis family protein [Intestinimonas timonensis]